MNEPSNIFIILIPSAIGSIIIMFGLISLYFYLFDKKRFNIKNKIRRFWKWFKEAEW